MSNVSNESRLGSGVRLALRRLTLPFRLLLSLSKAALAGIVVVLLVLNLATPVLTAAFSPLLSLGTIVAETIWDTMPPLRSAQAAAKTAADAADRAAKYARQLEQQVVALNKDLAEKAAQKVTYRAEKRTVAEAVSDTTSRISKRLKKTVAADISSMAAEAIPYVGVAIIVGSTANDIDQSCELMTDLHELDVVFNPDHAIDSREVCGMQVPTAAEVWAEMKSAPGAALDAARAAMPEFQWQAGWDDLMRQVPTKEQLEAAANSTTQTIISWWPEFHWQAGWDDLKKIVQP